MLVLVTSITCLVIDSGGYAVAKFRPSNTILIRIIISMFVFGFVIFIPIVLKLVNIQLIDYKTYQAKAIEQQTRDTVITPKRGTIYDRNGKKIAVSASAETVFIAPVDIKSEDEEKLVAQVLSETLSLDYDSVLEKTKNKKSYYQVIKKKIDIETANLLRQKIKENKLKAIHLAEDTKRYYPYGSFASHVIGFCGDDNNGLMGIEMVYENTLKGKPGRIISAKNARGADMPFKYEEYVDPLNGQNVVLTIDETVQQVLESHLRTTVVDAKVMQRGAGIVFDVKTGEILAMATINDFDLNKPFEITDESILQRLNSLPEAERSKEKNRELNAAWRNKIISDSYEPGSVFKILTVAMGLEEGVVNANSTFNCAGALKVADRTIRCWKREGHGNVTLSEALEKSCNCALMQIGARVGNRKFFDYVSAFGLLGRTGIDLPGEAGGFFFSEKDFTNPKNKVSLAVASFGQTFKVTPIQMVCAVSAIVNDGKYMKPHLVKEIVDDDGIVIKKYEPEMIRQVISRSTSEFICGSLEKVVVTGTGKNAYVKGYRIGGKTGTSEKIDEYVKGEREKYIASFIGIAPMDDPQIAILVMLDDPTGNYVEGSQVAAPVVGKVFAEILPYLGIEPVYTADELVGADIDMPRLTGATIENVRSLFTEKRYSKLKIKTIGEGNIVTDQIPAYGAEIPNNSEIIVYLGGKADDSKVKMPNVLGLSPEEANRVLTNAGLYMKAQGAVAQRSPNIKASKQQYSEGTELVRGTVVEILFYDHVGVSEGASGRY
jgi:stage V sporulation protein D (sporulation-specific penicillin-binding protein)